MFNRTRTFSSTFRVLADSITSLVKGAETYTDPVTGETKTNTFGTLLQQTANNVLIKATKGASTAAQGGQAIIESLINVAPEGIKIAASKVNIEGAAIFTSGKLSKVVVASSKQWYSSTSPTSRTGGEWSTNQPNVTAGRYLWERTYYTYSDGTNEYKPSSGGVCVTAPTDIGGTVTDVDVEYAQGTSPTTAPTSGWATDAPTIAAGRYLWTRTKTSYSDGTSEYTKTACISGDNGKLVTSAKEQYYLSTSNTTQTGGSWTDACPAWESGKYIWTRTYLTYNDGTNGAANVTLATALNEANRKANATITGVDVEYADSTSSTTPPSSGWQTSAPTWQAGHYIWQRTKTVTPTGTSYSQPTCISGRDGVDGRDGTDGTAAYTYSINCNPAALVRAENGTLTPSSVTFSATRAQGAGDPVGYAGRYIISEHNGTAWVDKYTSSSNERVKTYTPTSTAKVVKCVLYLANTTPGNTTPLDVQSAPIVSNGATGATGAKGADGTNGKDGANGRDGVDGKDGKDGANGKDGTSVTVSKIEYGVANNASTAPTSYSTTAPTSIAKGKWLWVKTTYSDGSTAINKSYVGTDGEDGTSIYVTSSSKTGGTTTVKLSDGTTMTINDGQDGSNGTAGKNGYVHTAWANSSDGSQGFSTTVSADKLYLGVYTDNTAADSTDYTKYSWSLIKGSDGASPNVYTVSANPTALVRAADGTLSPARVTFSATRSQGTGNPTAYAGRFVISEFDGSTWTDRYTSTSDGIFMTYQPRGAAKVVRCNLYLAGGTTTLLDTQSVPIATNGATGADGKDGKDGAKGETGATGAAGKDAYTVMLTNESHTFAGGTSAAIASSTTAQVIAFKGATQVAATIGSITGAPTGMSTSISNNGTKTATVTISVTTALKTRDGVLAIPVTVDGNAFSLTFSWAVAFAGAKGETGATGATGAKGDDGADGLGISSIIEQYYLSTSDTARVDGAWSATPPAWEKGKYYWTRSKITWSDNTVTYTDPVLANDVTSIATIAGGAVRKSTQLWYTKADTTPPLAPTTKVTSTSTAGGAWRVVVPTYSDSYPIYYYCWQYEAMDGTCTWSDVVLDNIATENQGNVRGAQARSQRIWCSTTSGTNTLSGNTTWVTYTGNAQNGWTATRPPYSANYPVIWTAIQSQTVAQQASGSRCSCTTPVKDNTTVINGGQITTGTIDASKVAVTNLDASKITSGTIDAARIGAESITLGKLASDVQSKLGNIDLDTAYRGVCSTDATTMTKRVACSGFDLKTGAAIVVYNTTAQTLPARIRLNVNDTGAKDIYVGDSVTDSSNQLLWAIGSTVTFVYDGSNWVVADNPGSWSGTPCYDMSSDAEKTTSCGKIVIFNGTSIKVPMGNYNTSESARLNVQSLGAKYIYFGSTAECPTYANGYTWKQGTLVEFVYAGSCWRTGSRTYVDGGDIVTGTIDAARLNVNQIRADIVEALEITGDKIKGGTISGVNFRSEKPSGRYTGGVHIYDGEIRLYYRDSDGIAGDITCIAYDSSQGTGVRIYQGGEYSTPYLFEFSRHIANLRTELYNIEIDDDNGIRFWKKSNGWKLIQSWS